MFYRSLATEASGFAEKAEKRIPLLQRVLHIRKVARVNSGGKIRSTSALVVVGDQNGHAGYGMGRGSDTATAVQKALAQAQKNIELIPRLENRTIYADMDFKFKRVQFKMRNAKPGMAH
jgi:small subunit ribosomal protein S5